MAFLYTVAVRIFEDVTDAILPRATVEDRGGLWWAWLGAFVLADVDRVLLFVPCSVLLNLEASVQGWRQYFWTVGMPAAEKRFDGARGDLGSALEWPILDGFMWAVVGSRSKSNSLMSLCGMAGNTLVDVLEQFGSVVDR